jgi:ABC-type methionine transport system ATPase subunit
MCETYAEDPSSSGTRGYRKERPGLPVRMETNESVEKVRALVTRNRRLGIGMIPQEMNMNKERTIIQISTMNFNMWNMFARKWSQRI